MQSIPGKPFRVDRLSYRVLAGPFGNLGVAVTERGVCNIRTQVPGDRAYREYLEQCYRFQPDSSSDTLKQVADELTMYFDGKLTRFRSPVDLRFGTAFQQKVWRKLRSIPYGQTRSYGWLAQAVGNPRACRAVGGANGKNPLPILIPCHRVIAGNGGLGGYTGGLPIKKYLLDLEQKLHAPL